MPPTKEQLAEIQRREQEEREDRLSLGPAREAPREDTKELPPPPEIPMDRPAPARLAEIQAREIAEREDKKSISRFDTVSVPEVRIPQGAEAVEWAWGGKAGDPSDVDKSKPTVFQKNDTQYYAPDSTMYQSGFRTSDEYRQAFDLGLTAGPHSGELVSPDSYMVKYGSEWVRVSPADIRRFNAASVKGEGRPFKGLIKSIDEGKYGVPVIAVSASGKQRQVILTPRQAEDLGKLTGAAQLQLALKLGLVPAGTKLIRGEWQYSEDAPVPQRAPGVATSTAIPSQSDLDKNYTHLPDDKYIENTQLSDIRRNNPAQYDVITNQGFEEYQRRYNLASSQLAGYRNKDGTFNLGKILLKRNDALNRAAAYLFTPATIDALKKRYSAGLTIGTGVASPYVPKDAVFYEPPMQYSGATDTITGPVPRPAGDYPLFKSIPAPLVAALGITAVSPIAGDELLVLGIIGSLLAVGTAVKVIEEFKKNNGRNPSVNDISIGGTLNTAQVSIGETAIPPITLREQPRSGTALTPPQVDLKLGVFKPAPDYLTKGVETDYPALDPAKLIEMLEIPPFSNIPSEAKQKLNVGGRTVWYPKNPADIPEAVRRQAGMPLPTDVLLNANDAGEAAKEYQDAAKKLGPVIQQATKTLGPEELGMTEGAFRELVKLRVMAPKEQNRFSSVDWDAVVRDMVKSKNQAEAARIYREAKEYEARIERMVQKALLEIEAMPKGQALVSNYRTTLIRFIDAVNSYMAAYNVSGQGETELARARVNAAGKALIAEATRAKTDTGLQTMQTLDTASASAILTRVAEQTKLATKTATAMAAKTVTGIKAVEATKTTAAAATADMTATATKTAEAANTTIKTIPKPPLPGDSDKKKREFLGAVPGLVARRRGELRGKSVWLVMHHPYKPEDKITILGDPPAGAKEVRGKGSVKASAAVIKGLAPTRRIYDDTGAVDDVIIPTGKRSVRIEHVRDTLSDRSPAISERRGRISGRGVRLTPRTPRLK